MFCKKIVFVLSLIVLITIPFYSIAHATRVHSRPYFVVGQVLLVSKKIDGNGKAFQFLTLRDMQRCEDVEAAIHSVHKIVRGDYVVVYGDRSAPYLEVYGLQKITLMMIGAERKMPSY